MKKVYISGAISGLEEIVYKTKFQEAEDKLKGFGFEVVNPVKIEHNHDKSYLSYMREDLKAMLDCDSIYMLDNWKDSNGAKIEHDLCVSLGINVVYESGEIDSPKNDVFPVDETKQRFLMHCISSDCKIASVHPDGKIGKTIKSDYNTILQCHSVDNDIRVVKKPISSISNEDAKELYFILNFTSRVSSINSLQHISVIKTRIKTFFNLKPEERGFSYHPVDVLRAYDYVRSLGYATEWNGISVEAQIENKWIIIE